jgi:hypothetical protein
VNSLSLDQDRLGESSKQQRQGCTSSHHGARPIQVFGQQGSSTQGPDAGQPPCYHVCPQDETRQGQGRRRGGQFRDEDF